MCWNTSRKTPPTFLAHCRPTRPVSTLQGTRCKAYLLAAPPVRTRTGNGSSSTMASPTTPKSGYVPRWTARPLTSRRAGAAPTSPARQRAHARRPRVGAWWSSGCGWRWFGSWRQQLICACKGAYLVMPRRWWLLTRLSRCMWGPSRGRMAQAMACCCMRRLTSSAARSRRVVRAVTGCMARRLSTAS